MNIDRLIPALLQRISGTQPNDWVLEEGLRPLLGLPEELQRRLLDQVPVIWPVSHSLCFNYLSKAADCMSCLHPDQLEDWVRGLLDAYESEGLRAAQRFMEDVEKHFLCRIRGETGLRLEEVQARLLPYIHGISGLAMGLEAGALPMTDTARIVLPAEMKVFADNEKNFLLYKFAATVQCGHLHFGTYRWRLAEDHPLLLRLAGSRGVKFDAGSSWLQGFFNLFDEPGLAADLFSVAVSARILAWIRGNFPGLRSDCRELLAALVPPAEPRLPRDDKTAVMGRLLRFLLDGDKKHLLDEGRNTSLPLYNLFRCLRQIEATSPNGEGLLRFTIDMYGHCVRLGGRYRHTDFPIVLGTIEPQRALAVIEQRRTEDRKQFIRRMAALLQQNETAKSGPEGKSEQLPVQSGEETGEGSLLLIASQADEKEAMEEHRRPVLRFLTVGGREIALPEEMQDLVSRITSDLGGLPVQYVSAAAGLAGTGSLDPAEVAGEEPEGALQGAILYDEWDYRRKGYKKDWCHVIEKKVEEVAGSFVGKTLDKHRGLLVKLRRQFELMRTCQQLVKRQWEGEEVDLDAVIEFFADRRAGLGPGERFFTRLQRDRRDIAVHFLVDMSSSTEGWIMNAIKESLLLMGESLAVLGDRFAIYGFSGMRRLRSDIFLVKRIGEPYDDSVRRRIAGIGPQEYTRMGPPIRHLIGKMEEVEARVRLLIILSDGKPEDYDDYKGRYAIEDTRHALIEAKAAGIHPFCITVDRQARGYIEHMYGEVNYIRIEDLAQLPARMPAVYRSLTSM